MRAREFTEALDQPYYLHWEHSTDGDVRAAAELPADEGYYNEGLLHIIFEPHRDNKDGSVAWEVEFWRNEYQDITGEGDQFRVFATVLQAINEFVAKYKPINLSFTATKKVEPWQKSMSRANLYDRLVQRYARASGYRAFRADTGNNVHYELVRINKDVSEGSGFDQEAGIGIDGKSFKFKIRDLVALADNYPVTKINPQQFSKQIADRDEDSTQSMARAEKADLQYPIIVVKRQNGKLWIADGTHRAHKAILNKLPSISAKIIPIKDMAPFDVKQGVAEGWKEKVAGAALAAAAVGAFGSANAKASPTTGDEFSTPIAGWSTKTDKAGNTTDRYQSGAIDMTATRNAQGQRVHSGGTYQVNKTAAVNVDVPYKDGQKGIATTVGRAANPSDLDHLMSVDAVAKRKGVDPKAFARFQQGSKEQGVPEGAVKDLDMDFQDQQWDAVVGYVVNGLKKNMDIGTMELNLYKWGGKEMFDVDQELEDRGFRDLADLVNHIKQYGGKYVPPTDFGLGVAENFADGKKPGRKGLAKRVGVNCKQPVSKLRSIAKNSSGERQRMAHWCANMKSGRK